VTENSAQAVSSLKSHKSHKQKKILLPISFTQIAALEVGNQIRSAAVLAC